MRYGSALELAEALEAGMSGEATAATRRLTAAAASSTGEMTQALPATQAISRVPAHAMPDRTQSIPPAPRRRTAAPASPRQRQRSATRRRWANFMAGLAILAAGVLVALAILQTSGSGNTNQVNEGDVHSQVQGLQDLIRSNSR